MTEIKSVYEWVVVLLNKGAMTDSYNYNMAIERYIGDGANKIECFEEITKLIKDKRASGDFLVMKVYVDYVGEEL